MEKYNENKQFKQTKLKTIQTTIKKPHKQHRHSLCTCWSFMDISRTVSENGGFCFIFGLQKPWETDESLEDNHFLQFFCRKFDCIDKNVIEKI